MEDKKRKKSGKKEERKGRKKENRKEVVCNQEADDWRYSRL